MFQVQVLRICSKSGIFVACDLINGVWDRDCQDTVKSQNGKHQESPSDPTFQCCWKLVFIMMRREDVKCWAKSHLYRCCKTSVLWSRHKVQTSPLMTWACVTYEVNRNLLASVIKTKSPCALLHLVPRGPQNRKVRGRILVLVSFTINIQTQFLK